MFKKFLPCIFDKSRRINKKKVVPFAKFDSKQATAQHFSLPFTIIFYICKESNPTNKILIKLYYSWKYFWLKIKILPFYCLWIQEYECGIRIKSRNNIKTVKSWRHLVGLEYKDLFLFLKSIDKSLETETRLVASLLTLWKLDLRACRLYNQFLTFNEFKLLSLNLEILTICKTKIVRQDMFFLIPLHELLMATPKLTQFDFTPNEDDIYKIYLKEKLSKLSEILTAKKLRDFILEKVPADLLDPILFANFIKNNFDFHSQVAIIRIYWTNWNNNIDKEWKQKFQDILENQIKSWQNCSYAFNSQSQSDYFLQLANKSRKDEITSYYIRENYHFFNAVADEPFFYNDFIDS